MFDRETAVTTGVVTRTLPAIERSDPANLPIHEQYQHNGDPVNAPVMVGFHSCIDPLAPFVCLHPAVSIEPHSLHANISSHYTFFPILASPQSSSLFHFLLLSSCGMKPLEGF